VLAAQQEQVAVRAAGSARRGGGDRERQPEGLAPARGGHGQGIWIRNAIGGFGWLYPGELRVFALDQLEVAKAWIAERPSA
jgi:hypothetical protein